LIQLLFYRYVGKAEAESIDNTGVIQSRSGVTWFTPDLYDSVEEAQRMLALPDRPSHRVGPIPVDELPDFDHCSLQFVHPAGPHPGGGLEAATTGHRSALQDRSFNMR
jgi:hypothetical protein